MWCTFDELVWQMKFYCYMCAKLHSSDDATVVPANNGQHKNMPKMSLVGGYANDFVCCWQCSSVSREYRHKCFWPQIYICQMSDINWCFCHQVMLLPMAYLKLETSSWKPMEKTCRPCLILRLGTTWRGYQRELLRWLSRGRKTRMEKKNQVMELMENVINNQRAMVRKIELIRYYNKWWKIWNN